MRTDAKTIRVLHVITGLNTGGAERQLARLVAAMDAGEARDAARAGRFGNHVVSLLPEGPEAAAVRVAGVPLTSLGMRRSLPSPGAVLRLARLLRRVRPHVVQSWLYHADLLATLARALAFPLGPRPKLVWNLRCTDMDFSRYHPLTRLTVRGLAALSKTPDVVLANAEAALAHHRALGYRPRRTLVMPNGFDTDHFRPAPEGGAALRQELFIAPDAPVVGLVARYDPQKGHGTFFRALALAAEKIPDLTAICCGTGVSEDNPELMAQVHAAGLEGKVRLLGRRTDLPRIYAALDLLCVSSPYGEGFPNVLGEAMACGVPCVATDVGDSRRIMGETGIAVLPEDPAALAEALLAQLERLAREGETLRAAVRERVLARYSLDAMAGRYEDFYRDLVAETT